MLSDKVIADFFDFPCPINGTLREYYRAGEEKEILSKILRPADAHIEINLKKGMLKRKYRLLLDVFQTVICEITFSKDGLSIQKIHILAALIDRSKNIIWVQMLKNRLIEESKKFYKNKKEKRIDLKKQISLVHKVTLLL